MALTTHPLFSSPLASVANLTCDTWSGDDRERGDPRSSVTIIRCGIYNYHARRQVTVADPGLALLYRGSEPYHLSHPFRRDLPDRSTRIEFDAPLLEEAFGPRPLARDIEMHLGPAAQIHHLQTLSRLGADRRDRLAAEEATLGLLTAIAADFDLTREDPRSPASARRRVQRARAAIAAEPAANLGLEAVAAAAGCSPFHLARLFKRETGTTLRGYRLRLRLALVLHDLAEGASDLTALAFRTGFSDHSHMTTTFRKAFGSTPSALRERLGSAGLARRSTFLQAASETDR